MLAIGIFNMDFIAKFIKIEWTGYDKNQSIDKNITNIDDKKWLVNIENCPEANIDYEIFINSYRHANFAVSFDNVKLDCPPYIQSTLESDIKHSMLEVFTQESKHWWIQEQSELRKNSKEEWYMESDFVNYVGQSYIIYHTNGQKKVIKVNVEDKMLGEQGERKILQEFKNEFYKLIYDSNSVFSESIKNDTASTFNIHTPKLSYIDEFITTLGKIINKPYLMLDYEEKSMPIHQVKTALRTTIEYSQNPHRRFYTSKSYNEEVNNPVNGYVFFITKNLIYYLEGFVKNLEQNDSVLKERNPDELTLPTREEIEEEFDNQNLANVQDIQKKQNKINSVISNISNWSLNIQNGEFIELRGYFQKGDWFFFHTIGENKLNLKFNELIHDSLESGNYIIKGNYQARTTNNNNKPFFDLYFIESIEIVSTINKEESVKSGLALRKKALVNQVSYHNKTIKQNKILIRDNIFELNTRISKLKIECQRLEEKGISPYFNKPSSKVFDYEIRYSKLIQLYDELSIRKALDILKLNNFINNSLLLSNIPKIYERWVLLKIISILIEKYRFEPVSKDWNFELAHQLCNKNENKIQAIIPMKHASQGELIVEYEKTLSNGKCPDYVLNYKSKKIVMDAKFKNLDLLKMLNDLDYYKENENKNWLYIITIMDNVVKGSTSGMVWSKKAFYGESKLKEQIENMEEVEYPNHAYGGIFLHPDTTKYHSNNIDNLQRLIGMFLQINDYGNCIKCGGDYKVLKTRSMDEDGTRSEKRCCEKCSHIWYINHCKDCRNPIYKNGDYWTYHKLSLNESTRILQLSNIACPACGSYFE